MMKWIRNIALVICITSIVFMITDVFNEEPLVKEHYKVWENSFEETASKNMVTAIYLDYRLFDTFIEAIILFVAVGGIIFMSKKDQDVT